MARGSSGPSSSSGAHRLDTPLEATFSGACNFARLVTLDYELISRRSGGPTDTSQEYEFTDWQAVDRFSEDLARALADEVQGTLRHDA
jgi:menaquinone-dependent protoporphyrinogen IX oxidase